MITKELEDDARSEWAINREVYRPWGKFDAIDNGDRYQVKRITVKPGARLSLQMHHHRAEHWVVVYGTARVTKGDEIFLLSENESTYIPVGVVHALENPGKVDLQLIEIQSGRYLALAVWLLSPFSIKESPGSSDSWSPSGGTSCSSTLSRIGLK